MSEADVDLLIVGGGINGAGIARDAAGRGLRVLLAEKNDLAAHTSSASSKPIHGGLRYLEQFEFRLVRESLAEREKLLRAAPHIIEPLEFVLPLTPFSRPAWMVRAGLLLYDFLGGRSSLPDSRVVRLDREPSGDGLKAGNHRGFAYWDCRVQDSRLVVLNAVDAAERAAAVFTRTELIAAHRDGKNWHATIRGTSGERTIRARALVNAAGPWAGQLFDRLGDVKRRRRTRLVKGSHLVLPRLYRGEHAFILQNPDHRVVFAIPFEERFTLVGTTDVEWPAPPADPAISDEEIDYLLQTVGRTFMASVTRDDIVWTFSGLRALADDSSLNPSRVTRDYVIDMDAPAGAAPLLSVFGGKITTYRRLAERALDQLMPVFPTMGGAWTSDAVLPGGDIRLPNIESYSKVLARRHPNLPAGLLERLARTYGTRTDKLLDGVESITDLGEDFGAGLTKREVDYLVANEWARTPEDVLFRRTKLGLHLPETAAARLQEYMDAT